MDVGCAVRTIPNKELRFRMVRTAHPTLLLLIRILSH